MANRTGLDSTTLHYLAVRQAIMSVHNLSFKHHANLLTYLADWLLYTLENGFQSDIKGQGDPFLDFAFKPSLHLLIENHTKIRFMYMYCQLHRHIDDLPMLSYIVSPLPSLYPLCHSHEKLFQALSHFFVLQMRESLGMRLDTCSIYPYANSPSLVRNDLKTLQILYFG